jgi:hypothetical protein
MMAATLTVAATGTPSIVALSLMPGTRCWLPVEDCFEHQVVGRLVMEGRSFVKALRYNLPAPGMTTTAVLTDAGTSPVSLFIAQSVNGSSSPNGAFTDYEQATDGPAWVWDPSIGAMPKFPRQTRISAERDNAAADSDSPTLVAQPLPPSTRCSPAPSAPPSGT